MSRGVSTTSGVGRNFSPVMIITQTFQQREEPQESQSLGKEFSTTSWKVEYSTRHAKQALQEVVRNIPVCCYLAH